MSRHSPPLLSGNATAKGLRAEAQRAVTPEQTLERVRPLFGRVGLTRLADITGLDSVGIPVVLSVRPQSGYLSVDGGKGFTPLAAAASAAMECFERHAGEQTPVECFTSPYADLPEDARIDVVELPLARNSLFSPRSPQRWTWAEDILGGRDARVAVPSVMVSLERHRHPRSSTLPFHFSSNGLNSGNTPSEALVGGLYEVIERDATTCTKVSWDNGAPMRRVDLGSAESAGVALLLDRVHRAGLKVVVLDCTVDTAVPTFCAYLCDVENPAMGLYHGYGTHLDPEVAVIRAICEAAQGRLVFIAGSRDDSFRHHRLLHRHRTSSCDRLLALEPTVDLGDHPDQSTETFEADGRVLLDRVRSVGAARVLAVNLTHPDVGVDVFRVIVPGFEGYMLEDFVPGPRARAWASQRGAGAGSAPTALRRDADALHTTRSAPAAKVHAT